MKLSDFRMTNNLNNLNDIVAFGHNGALILGYIVVTASEHWGSENHIKFSNGFKAVEYCVDPTNFINLSPLLSLDKRQDIITNINLPNYTPDYSKDVIGGLIEKGDRFLFLRSQNRAFLGEAINISDGFVSTKYKSKYIKIKIKDVLNIENIIRNSPELLL